MARLACKDGADPCAQTTLSATRLRNALRTSGFVLL